MQPLGWLSRIVGRALIVPPPMFVVFSMRNYVRVAQISSLDRDWDGGRIARRALNVPGDPVVGYSGLSWWCPGAVSPNWRFALEGCFVLLLRGPQCVLPCGASVCISINCYDPPRSWHLELEVCIMLYRIEFCKCGSPEQCVIATTERDNIED